MVYYVYVLQSLSTGKRYVGQTEDLQRRLAEHNSPDHNARKFTTRQRGPWELIYHETRETRSEAMLREHFLKGGCGREWLNRQPGGASPPQAD